VHRHLRRFAAPLAIVAVTALLTSCHALRFYTDIVVYPATGTTGTLSLRTGAHGDSGDGLVWVDINSNCVNGIDGGDWGDVGSSVDAIAQVGGSGPYYSILTSLGTPPSEETVNCMLDEIQDDPEDEGDNESIICNDTGTAEPDCQDPDGAGMGYYQLNSDATGFYQAAFDTYAEVEAYIVLVRDREVEDGQTGGGAPGTCSEVAYRRCIEDPMNPGTGFTYAPNCIGIRIDSTWVTGTTNGRTASWQRLCPS
jgi:hypothetical protein